VRLYKAGSGIASVTWEDCVVVALCHGWIDSKKQSDGPEAWLQRLTPRKKGSGWSQRNRAHVERLIAAGEMTEAGMAEVRTAQADGRWDAAYAGSKTMEIPADFIAALEGHPVAAATFAGLNRQNLFAIYHRLHVAPSPEARARRVAKLIATLEAGKTFN
jgi:uncharacterized protein YdeI (YjbR/CyaY-like superfamily)